MVKSLRIAIVIVSASGFAVSRAEAQAAVQPTAVKEVRAQLGASINNAGLQQSLDFSWRRSLSSSKSLFMSEAHVAIGGTAAATPASLRGGAWIEVAPV